MSPIVLNSYMTYDEKKIRNWLVMLGWILTGLGLICMVASFSATMATVIFFGILLLFAGIVQLAHTLMARGGDFSLRLISGVLYSVVGGMMIADPVGGAIGLTLLLGLLFLASGIVRLVVSFSARRLGFPAGWHLSGAALNLILALLILTGWPAIGNWLIGLLLGIELLFAGVTMIFFTSRLLKTETS